MNKNGKQPRSALLIRCTAEEAEAIRKAAASERRTVSGFVLHAVMSRMTSRQRIEAAVKHVPNDSSSPPRLAKRSAASGNGNGSAQSKQLDVF